MSMHRQHIAIHTIILSIVGNVILAVIKWLAGYLGNSFALIADAIESTTDILSSILVLMGLKYASRPADRNHPYGHGRIEPLVTFVVVGFLMISAVFIATESIRNIRNPHDSPEPYTLVVLAVVILIKEVLYRFIRTKSRITHSSALRSDAWHHRSDALTSAAAFIGISLALIFGDSWAAADDWAAMIVSVIILYNCYLIFRPALGEIMDEHMYDELVDEIRVISMTIPGVLDTEKCHIRKTGMQYLVDLHVIVDGQINVAKGHEIAHRLKDVLMLRLPELADVLIHIEPDAQTSKHD